MRNIMFWLRKILQLIGAAFVLYGLSIVLSGTPNLAVASIAFGIILMLLGSDG